MASATLVGILLVGSIVVIGLKMLGLLPGGMRGEALERVTVGLLWFVIATPLFAIWFFIGFVLMVIDVLLQLITGGESIMPMNAHWTAYEYFVSNLSWTLYGRGEFDPLPYV